MSECVPSHKHHTDDGNVRQHIEADEKKLCGVKSERQAPKTAQQNAGEVLDVRRSAAQGVEIGINNTPPTVKNHPKEFQYRKHMCVLKTVIKHLPTIDMVDGNATRANAGTTPIKGL